MTIKSSLVLGIDLGTSGVRIAVVNQNNKLIHLASCEYFEDLRLCKDWQQCCKNLIEKIPVEIKDNLIACAVDGTSGTLMGCNYSGEPLGEALPYFVQFNEKLKNTFDPQHTSIGRALHLIKKHGKEILLRHQADWINGWLLDNWTWGEEGNNLRLGWNQLDNSWPKQLKDISWFNALPKIVSSGSVLGKISPTRAKELCLPKKLKIIAGTTDSNAAVLATEASYEEGISVLGSTIVIKRFTQKPLEGVGISNHRLYGKWLTGGASNAGCTVLKRFFSDKDLAELSRQIDPETNSGLELLPLPFKGERFPVNDSNLNPILEPRPVSDSLYLQALLEGLSRIEAMGWQKLANLEFRDPPEKIITIGGGARNPQWRRIRERIIGIPIKTCSRTPAEGVALLALKAMRRNP
ncbi:MULTISPECIES: FGGY-family carbohydrate kinase [Prochlorococcus]|uniref:Sugar kinase n=1 Tax=Prochlorococcus marinus (strain SARG / CCMP1375 / SS120) TaxID=167539 RepID=Q7VDM8_PROMA|nr:MULTISPECIES: FGGY-family carbohydrate kinase [Prochlorococcus]AAP99394.1 Sugar kinase [Prochlorococcus marinus subsp. marinus str. CCMP1375]KGG11334.1 Carbohydrate kinase [Prochlorococcus marinus str. LG]KGG18710.1 Carbohydrate kinase [Prochlorococcus marinus str. SS2]KGG22984.1 Carbohydrate kinase [Prochlorococcus marinus str. SS35]KGG34088.1 Carbohydrate kinase [Prochlorococcus marinus str. SS51]